MIALTCGNLDDLPVWKVTVEGILFYSVEEWRKQWKYTACRRCSKLVHGKPDLTEAEVYAREVKAYGWKSQFDFDWRWSYKEGNVLWCSVGAGGGSLGTSIPVYLCNSLHQCSCESFDLPRVGASAWTITAASWKAACRLTVTLYGAVLL